MKRSGENTVLSNAYSERRERSGTSHVDSKLSYADNIELFMDWEIAPCLCGFASPGAWASLPTSTARSISHACTDIKSYLPVCFCNLWLSSFVLRCYVISLPSSLFLRLLRTFSIIELSLPWVGPLRAKHRWRGSVSIGSISPMLGVARDRFVCSMLLIATGI